ncbi:hydroxyethylthiazole kinase [uncultured Desulfovibrio sp.]|uniref:hydroxyethylthiazole kinase n=1 Tax=uncultured Desulfovibrio sp. TaxID=167968 RepID=UPI00263245E6|nr:hydroxyethylthiazole kinase [uncultured Desulfovibrio sp.]
MHDLADLLPVTRRSAPLVHFITNYVTVNDCANITIAAGGSPIMADDPAESEDITRLCAALVLNMGTPCARTRDAMLAAGREANRLGHPIILDPVGAGASAFRNSVALDILRHVRPTVIKGNISEIRFLAEGVGSAKGVDACPTELVNEANLAEALSVARRLHAATGAVIVISGPIDLVADGDSAWAVDNGHPMMARLSGTGCMSAGVIACHCGAHPGEPLRAALCGMVCMGISGELAHQRLTADEGTGSYRVRLHDAMSRLDADILRRACRVRQLA